MELKIPIGPAGTGPTLVTYHQASDILNVGQTTLRELLPRLDARMVGRRPMVATASLRAYLAALPRVTPGKAR